jgi:hypothetical protein
VSKMTDMPSIDELHAQLADALRRIAVLEGAKHAPPKLKAPAIEEGVGIICPAPRNSGFASPKADELRGLLRAVLTRWPALDPKGDTEAFYAGFCGAFRPLSLLARTEAPDRKHYAAHWLDVAQQVAVAAGLTNNFEFRHLHAAALAHADIPMSNWQLPGAVLEFGLSEFGMGRKPVDAWRGVLEGQFRALVEPPKPYKPSRRAEINIAGVWQDPSRIGGAF